MTDFSCFEDYRHYRRHLGGTVTKTEIFLALDLARDTLIQAHVKINESMDQIEKLKARIQEDIQKEPEP